MKKSLVLQKRAVMGLAFFAPAFIIFLLGFTYPLIRIVMLALTMPDGTLGIGTIARVFSDATLRVAIQNSIIFAALSVTGHLVIGFFLASLMNIELNPKFVKIARSAIIIPWAISPVVVAMIFRLLYHPVLSVFSGLYSNFPVMAQGVLANERFALFFVVIINIWYATPFYFLLILARMQSIPREIYEAAAIDGTDYFKNLIYISLPILKPLIVTLAIFDIVLSLNTFDLIWITTMGGPGTSTEVLATYIYRTAFRGAINFEYAAAMGIVLLTTIMLICGMTWIVGREKTGE